MSQTMNDIIRRRTRPAGAPASPETTPPRGPTGHDAINDALRRAAGIRPAPAPAGDRATDATTEQERS